MATFCKRRRSTPAFYNITITGRGHAECCYVEMEGNKYIEAGEYTAPYGLVFRAFVKGGDDTGSKPGYIIFNGDVLVESAFTSPAGISFQPDGDMKVALSYDYYGERFVIITLV